MRRVDGGSKRTADKDLGLLAEIRGGNVLHHELLVDIASGT